MNWLRCPMGRKAFFLMAGGVGVVLVALDFRVLALMDEILALWGEEHQAAAPSTQSGVVAALGATGPSEAPGVDSLFADLRIWWGLSLVCWTALLVLYVQRLRTLGQSPVVAPFVLLAAMVLEGFWAPLALLPTVWLGIREIGGGSAGSS